MFYTVDNILFIQMKLLSLLFKEEKVIYKYVDNPCFTNNCYTVEITNINIPFF